MKRIQLDILNLPENYCIDEDTEIDLRFKGTGNTQIQKKVSFIHQKPNIKSRINLKSVLFDSSKLDFEGILKIDKGAVGTDTYLKIDCLIVGENAHARAIPSLEIKESEVKGGHGATIGYLDEVQINYLKSRGLDDKSAEQILIEAFLK